MAHLIINAMGAVLLAGGSFSMQCIAAPNRNEVNAAHQHGRTFDIGTPASQMSSASRDSEGSDGLLWQSRLYPCISGTMLITEARPQLIRHTSYNSAIFEILSANDYVTAVTNEDFLDPLVT